MYPWLSYRELTTERTTALRFLALLQRDFEGVADIALIGNAVSPRSGPNGA